MKETNQNHLISVSTEQKMLINQRKISFGTPVEILKGPLRGCKGKIIGSTNDGVFSSQNILTHVKKKTANL